MVAKLLLGNNLHYRHQLNKLIQHEIREREWDVIHIEDGFPGGLVDRELPIAKGIVAP
jgi:hypothetical protein